jgi:EpsD family peptidyl-prolyl cis-trans isomerase
MKYKPGLNSAALAIAMATVLSACGNKAPEASQVAAKVNKDEVTVHQINFELAKMQNVPADQTMAAAKHVLRGLVEQELLVQQAIDTKLDRDPDVVERLDADRRQVLAQAYINSITSKAVPPTEAEIHDYYDKNPLLFSDRRIYKLQELNVPVTKENVDSITDKLKSSPSIQVFVDWLKSVNIQAQLVQSVKPAEQIPFQILPRIHDLKEGQTVVIKTPSSLNVIQVTGSQAQPVTEAQAKGAIGQYLMSSRKRELADAEVKRLHDGATIKYLGDYAGMEKGDTNKDTANTPAVNPLPDKKEAS